MTFKNILPDQHNSQVHNTKSKKEKGQSVATISKGY